MASEEAQRGTKRKRYEPRETDIGIKISGKLHHAVKEVRKAAKKAKTFETQKLVKKLKSLRGKVGNDSDISELETQLELLKEIDHEPIAHTALKTKLNKDRVLSENEHVQGAIAVELISNLLAPSAAGTAAAKLESRLLSAKNLATEVASVVADLKVALLPKPVKEEDDDYTEVVDRPAKLKKSNKAASVSTLAVQVGKAEPETQHEIDETGWESGSASDEAGWESGSIDAKSVSEELSDEQKIRKAPSNKKIPTVNTKAGESTFLPSLAVGFVRGGSLDSDWSDSEAKIAEAAPTKNRRGQRARRAIWEKKFGRGANHKKKELEEQEAAEAARRAKATAKANQFTQPKDGGWAGRSAQVNAPVPSSRYVVRPEDKPLHPSWEAKKKLKEKQSAGIVPSLGTKIKF